MLTFILDDYHLSCKIRYSRNRKTILLRVPDSHHVEILAPPSVASGAILQFIQEKKDWILSQIKRLHLLQDNPVNQSIAPGSLLLFGGNYFTLQTTSKLLTPPIAFHEDTLMVSISHPSHLPDLPQIIISWFQQVARKTLNQKTALWADKIEVLPQTIRMKDQKTRWGSCSSRGNINYNWRIIMAPPDVQDYIVIHELCHLRIPNHSREFWLLVQYYIPNYQQHRLWLKTNGHFLARLV